MANGKLWRMGSVNETPASNIYPKVGGASTGMRASSQSPFSAQGDGIASDEAAMAVPEARGVAGGFFGQPLTWWAVLVAMLFALMFVAKRVGQASEFSNVRLSAYNVLVISLAAIIGIGFFKVLFARVNVPGLSTFIAAV